MQKSKGGGSDMFWTKSKLELHFIWGGEAPLMTKVFGEQLLAFPHLLKIVFKL